MNILLLITAAIVAALNLFSLGSEISRQLRKDPRRIVRYSLPVFMIYTSMTLATAVALIIKILK